MGVVCEQQTPPAVSRRLTEAPGPAAAQRSPHLVICAPPPPSPSPSLPLLSIPFSTLFLSSTFFSLHPCSFVLISGILFPRFFLPWLSLIAPLFIFYFILSLLSFLVFRFLPISLVLLPLLPSPCPKPRLSPLSHFPFYLSRHFRNSSGPVSLANLDCFSLF